MSPEKQLLTGFLEKFPELNGDLLAEIREALEVKTFPKGAVLQEQGQIPPYCFFVLRGCVRQFQRIDGADKSTAFFTEDFGAVSSTCYAQQIPSDHFLVCLEPSTLIVGSKEKDEEIFARFPILATVMGKVMEEEWGKTQAAFAAFVTASPEQRYLHLMETRPDLFQRASLSQIASYIGISAESLSRIRKRISQKS